MFGIDDAVTGAVAGATKLIEDGINKLWPNPDDKAKAEVIVMQATSSAAISGMAQQMSVMLAEANSEHWLAACWRPIVMLTFTVLIVARWLGFSAPNLSQDEVIKLWDIVQLGLGGYVIGRSVEKIMPQVVQAVKR